MTHWTDTGSSSQTWTDDTTASASTWTGTGSERTNPAIWATLNDFSDSGGGIDFHLQWKKHPRAVMWIFRKTNPVKWGRGGTEGKP